MSEKYWVPAIARADLILQAIVEQPGQLRLIDLAKRLDINKSSMFSLLATLEKLNWVTRERNDTYRIGSALAMMASASIQQFSLLDAFHQEAAVVKQTIGESIQLAKLDGSEVLYLAKEEAPTPVRLASEPGMRFPAHATALGKAMLSDLPEAAIERLYPGESPSLAMLTPHTLSSRQQLWDQLQIVKRQGYAFDLQESVIGFCCAAAPIRDVNGKIVAAVSSSMPQHQWELKKESVVQEICKLAGKLSRR